MNRAQQLTIQNLTLRMQRSAAHGDAVSFWLEPVGCERFLVSCRTDYEQIGPYAEGYCASALVGPRGAVKSFKQWRV